VHHGRALVDAPAHPRHDAVDDLQQVLVVAEDDRRRLELAEPFDVDLTRAVDQDVGDVRVAHERLDRPEAVDLVQELLGEPLAVAHAPRDRLLLAERGDGALQLRVGRVHRHARAVGPVHAVAPLAMPAVCAPLAGAFARGMARSGSWPIARTGSGGLTGPGITCENTGWMSWADTLRRSSSSIMRRAARTPGTERSVRMRMWSDCSNA